MLSTFAFSFCSMREKNGTTHLKSYMEEIFIIFGLILLNGVFAMAEIALISARKSRLMADAKKGSQAAQKALDLANEPNRFLSTVQIGITLIGILTGIYSGNQIASLFKVWLSDCGVSAEYAGTIAQGVIVVIVTYLTLVFGELLPKQIGINAAESVAKTLSRPMYWLSKIAAPFVWLLSQSTTSLFRLLGLHNKSNKVTEDEIKSIIQEGAEDGEVQPVEQDIVERVFLMGDLKIGSIMTHRHDLTWLDISMSAQEVRQILAKDTYELYPVADGDLDHIKGVVSLKDLILTLDQPQFSLQKILRESVYFYEYTSVYKVLETMKSQGISRGLVHDEFGCCIGIICLRDIMEALVGMVVEKNEKDADIIKRKDKEEWLVDGLCTMYDFLVYFDQEQLYKNDDFTTVAGLCLDQLDGLPHTGESFIWHSFQFEIVDMDGARIDKLSVSRIKEENPVEE